MNNKYPIFVLIFFTSFIHNVKASSYNIAELLTAISLLSEHQLTNSIRTEEKASQKQQKLQTQLEQQLLRRIDSKRFKKTSCPKILLQQAQKNNKKGKYSTTTS